jgi:uncharacterized transporter YbjL
MAEDNSIPLSWILLFLVLTLGIGVGAVYFVGGTLGLGAVVVTGEVVPSYLGVVPAT